MHTNDNFINFKVIITTLWDLISPGCYLYSTIHYGNGRLYWICCCHCYYAKTHAGPKTSCI